MSDVAPQQFEAVENDQYWSSLSWEQIVDMYESEVGLDSTQRTNLREFLLDRDHLKNKKGQRFNDVRGGRGYDGKPLTYRFAKLIEFLAAVLLEDAIGEGKVILASAFEDKRGTDRTRLRNIKKEMGRKDTARFRDAHKFDVMVEMEPGVWAAIDITFKRKGDRYLGFVDALDARGPLGITQGPRELPIPKFVFRVDSRVWTAMAQQFLRTVTTKGRHAKVAEDIQAEMEHTNIGAVRGAFPNDPIWRLYQAAMRRRETKTGDESVEEPIITNAKKRIRERLEQLSAYQSQKIERK